MQVMVRDVSFLSSCSFREVKIIIIIINLLSAISQWFNGALQFKLKK